MLSGATPSALAMAGTAVFRMVVSRDSMKKATATSHGKILFTDAAGSRRDVEAMQDSSGTILVTKIIASILGIAKENLQRHLPWRRVNTPLTLLNEIGLICPT